MDKYNHTDALQTLHVLDGHLTEAFSGLKGTYCIIKDDLVVKDLGNILHCKKIEESLIEVMNASTIVREHLDMWLAVSRATNPVPLMREEH